MYKCKCCDKEFGKYIQLNGHMRIHADGFKLKPKKKKIKHVCKFCNREFQSGVSLGGHTTGCKLNPNYEKWIKDLSVRNKKCNVSNRPDVRKKISETIFKKIKEGTWHNSFSRARTHEYNGMKFYGTWELRYAKYLDEKNINWKKNTDKFDYFFEGQNRIYTPDFYLIDERCHVEIKGYETEKDRAKWNQFPTDKKLKVLKGEELFKLGIIDNFRNLKGDGYENK